MKKIYSYIVCLPVILLSLIPSIHFQIDMPGKEIWFWYVLIAAFFGLLTLFLKINIFVKIIAVGSFINCFFSAAPYYSFTAYISLVLACYYYIVCTKVEDWRIVFNSIKVVLLLNALLLGMQLLGRDSLLSFGLERVYQFGTIGQHMQMGSLSVVLAAVLLPVNPLALAFPVLVSSTTNSIWGLFVVAVIVFIYFFNKHRKIAVILFTSLLLAFMALCSQTGKIGNLSDKSRVGMWKRSFELTNERPIFGYGIGTFHHMFHPLSKKNVAVPWKTGHNFVAQLAFETGYPGAIFALFVLFILGYKLMITKNMACLAGLIMLVLDGLVHFPDRMIQTVPIIIVFLAYCSYKIKESYNG